MKWLEEPGCWVFDDGRVAVPCKQGLRYPKQTRDRLGYFRACIHRKSFAVHRLVAVAFVRNPENKPTVDHINRIRDDNRATNLRWATQREQVLNSSKVIDALNKYGVRQVEDHRTYIRRYQREYRHLNRDVLNAKRRERYAAKKAALHPDPASSQES